MCSGDAPPLDLLAREDPGSLPDGTLCDEMVRLRRLLDAGEAAFTRRVGAMDRSQAHFLSGALSTAAWLRHACRLSPGAAAEQARTARRLRELPETEAAFAAGEIGREHAFVIARCAGEVGAEAARDAEPILVEAARELDPGRLRVATRHLRHALDPGGALDGANRDHERRRLHLSQTLDGLFMLDGVLDPEGGAALGTALEAVMGPRAGGDERSPAQRRADALVDLARRQLDVGELPEVAGERPHLTLTADVATLAGLEGAPMGELEWGGPVVTETVRRLACDAVVTPVLVGEGGEPLSVGRARRTAPAAVRRAVAARDRGCAWPGCGRPRGWTDFHHLVAWAQGGGTSAASGCLLCRPHHRMAHEGGWRLERGAGGRLVALPP